MRLLTGITAVLLVATPAFAEPSAEIKAGTGVHEREIVGEAKTFSAGTTVYVWSAVSGMPAATSITHVWKKDGVQFNRATLGIGAKTPRWRTSSRHPHLRAGSYTVEVVTHDGKSLGSVSFTVT